MGPPVDPGGGHEPPLGVHEQHGQEFMTSARAEGGGQANKEPKRRSFAEIIASEKVNRNIVQIYLKKIPQWQQNGDYFNPKSLNYDDLGEFIFDIVKINFKDCLSFNFNSGRYDSREIKFKQEIDVTPYLTPSDPFTFKGHEIRIKKQRNNVTKATFKHVPLNIPDEELLRLCSFYGKPVDHIVHVERLTNMRNKGMAGSTRWI